MAFDAAEGRAYFLGTEAESEEARLLRYCATTLTRFGAVPAWHSEVVPEVAEAAPDPFVLDYDGADSALIAVDLGGTSVTAVRVTAEHPDSALCIVADGSEGELEVEVTEDARASFILVVAPARGVALDLTAVPAEPSYTIVVHTDEGLDVSGPDRGVGEYDAEAWEALSLVTLSELPAQPRARLVLMDWASQATLGIDLAHRPAGSALAWVEQAP
jgi:hypothetical protein